MFLTNSLVATGLSKCFEVSLPNLTPTKRDVKIKNYIQAQHKMNSNTWFLVSGATIFYVFVIVLIVAILATCSSCLSFYNCIRRDVGQPVITKSTSMAAINDMMISNRSQVEEETLEKMPNSILVTSRIRSSRCSSNLSNHDQIETEA